MSLSCSRTLRKSIGQAAHAGFALMLSGHTHGGQICLPGGIPILLEADLPRAFGAGAWRHAGMAGYTSVGAGSSVVPVRFNLAYPVA
jgi:predicted MPP superfamily phosphohydrolase